jgi:hypothetical protein
MMARRVDAFLNIFACKMENHNMKRIPIITLLMVTALIAMSCSQKVSPEETAIKLAEESKALGGNLSVKLAIEKWLEERGDEVRPIGWDASKKDDQLYQVSYKYKIYSFREGTGDRGFFFEVDLAAGSVRNVTREVMSKMGALTPSFKREEEIREEFMQKLREDKDLPPIATP